MTKQEIISDIKSIYFQDDAIMVGNYRLESYREEGDWQIVVRDMEDEDVFGCFCYYDSYADEFKVVTPDQMFEMISEYYDLVEE